MFLMFVIRDFVMYFNSLNKEGILRIDNILSGQGNENSRIAN